MATKKRRTKKLETPNVVILKDVRFMFGVNGKPIVVEAKKATLIKLSDRQWKLFKDT